MKAFQPIKGESSHFSPRATNNLLTPRSLTDNVIKELKGNFYNAISPYVII